MNYRVVNNKLVPNNARKKNNIYLDYIRVFSCLLIMLYHFGVLKGGYLAVCTFFVLSGYLSFLSAYKKDIFSFKDYYKNKFIHLYLPLLLVVLTTVALINILSSGSYLSLKPEVKSVLFGYNNYWQLSANLDYFARHITSPFMHLWYIAILLQFDLVFPFIYKTIKCFEKKTSKGFVSALVFLLASAFTVFFYIKSNNTDLMSVYYGTLTRLFSLLFGLWLGMIHSYYGPLVFKITKYLHIKNFIILFYYISLFLISLLVSSTNNHFAFYMILVTFISMRLIDYAIIDNSGRIRDFDKKIKELASFTYEIYLIQYPIVYFFENLNIVPLFKTIIMIVTNIIVAYFIHYGLSFRKKRDHRYLRFTVFVIMVCFSLFGLIKFINTEDHSKEMKELEKQLNINEKMMQEKQEEYAKKLQEENAAWEDELASLDVSEDKLKELITNLSLVGVGDSVMLGAVDNLYKTFPNGYFDAKISRTPWVANGILQDLKSKNMLGDAVVLGLGANGDCSESCKDEILNTIGNRKLFWVNVTNDQNVHVNSRFKDYADKHDNVFVIDWETISKGHGEYFYADGIHLTIPGRKAYVEAIYENIYETYLNDLKNKKDEAIKAHEEKLKDYITFYGNDLLLNAFDLLHSYFSNAKFNINKNYNYTLLKETIEKAIKEETLSNKLVFAFDSSAYLSKEDYSNLISLCGDREVYVVLFNDSYDLAEAKVINFKEKLNENSGYMLVDGKHLSSEGNTAFSDLLKSELINE